MLKNVMIVTTTSYKSVEQKRFGFAKKLLENALKAGYRIAVIDSSPDKRVKKFIESLGLPAQVSTQQGSTMGASRREVFLDAASQSQRFVKATLWTEAEKYDIINWIPRIVEPILSSKAEIVIPKRSRKSWETFPKYQFASESIANRVYKEATGFDADPTFGPVAFSRKMDELFCECNPYNKWRVEDNYIQHFAPLEALAKGIKVESVEVDFEYPPEQKAEEETVLLKEMIERRLWQLNQLVDGYFKVSKDLGLKS